MRIFRCAIMFDYLIAMEFTNSGGLVIELCEVVDNTQNSTYTYTWTER